MIGTPMIVETLLPEAFRCCWPTCVGTVVVNAVVEATVIEVVVVEFRHCLENYLTGRRVVVVLGNTVAVEVVLAEVDPVVVAPAVASTVKPDSHIQRVLHVDQ